MSRRITLCTIIALHFSTSVLASPHTVISENTSTESIAVTVYNSGRGLISEKRRIDLPQGDVEVRFMDVAEKIKPETVSFLSESAPSKLSVLEQNYEYDLLSPQKLLEKFTGQKLVLVSKKLTNSSEVIEKEEATLLSTNSGGVWKIGGKIVTTPPFVSIEYPHVPENLISKPTLVWLLRSTDKLSHTVRTSYLTENLSWKADYVFTLAADEKSADLVGWVTISNTSGASYQNAKLKLIAGSVNQVEDSVMTKSRRAPVQAMELAAGSPQFEEKSFFEYHLYALQRPATIKHNQQKQITLLEGRGTVPVKKYFLDGTQNYFLSQGMQTASQKVKVKIEIKNSKENNLGIPLPAGIVRVYQSDTDGSSQFIGEDRVDHTPKDEKVTLSIGEAFDLVAERTQVDWKSYGSSTYESAHKIVLRNHKKEDVVITVREPIGGEWQILKSTFPHTKSAAFSAEFEVPVKAGNEAVLEYRVRSRY